MNGFVQAFSAVTAGAVIAFAVSFPLQTGLNALAVKICSNSVNRELVTYADNFFGGKKVACVPKKYV